MFLQQAQGRGALACASVCGVVLICRYMYAKAPSTATHAAPEHVRYSGLDLRTMLLTATTTTTAPSTTPLSSTTSAPTSAVPTRTSPALPPRVQRLYRARWEAHDVRPPPAGACFALDRARGHATPEGPESLALSYDNGPNTFQSCAGWRDWAARVLETTLVNSRQLPPGPSTDKACREAGKNCTGRVQWENGMRMAPFARGCSMSSCFDGQRKGCRQFLAKEQPRGPLPVFMYPRPPLDQAQVDMKERERRVVDRALGGGGDQKLSAHSQWMVWDDVAAQSGPAAAQKEGIIEVVDNADDACILVMMAFEIPKGGGKPAHWGPSGANHLLFHPRAGHPDRSGLEFPTDDAMIAFGAHTPFTYRRGFDLELPCTWLGHYGSDGRFDPRLAAEPRPPSNRSLLIFFKGSVGGVRVYVRRHARTRTRPDAER
jgi:hypothetical protein